MGKYWKEFRQFAIKGNVVDLAVAVVIGGAFGKIVSSLVADIVMPLVGVIIGGVNFASWKWTIEPIFAGSSQTSRVPVTMNIGLFIQNIFDFLIIALSVFFMVKILSHLKHRLIREEAVEKQAEEPKLSEDQKLLTEIRDILKENSQKQ